MASRAAVGPAGAPAIGAATTPTDIIEPRGLRSWITTVDHKRIGIFYLTLAVIYFLIGGLEAVMIRVQLSSPNNTFISADTYNQLFTMHGTTMIFLAIMPLSGAFFNFLVPLMIGARDVAFPRLNAFSWWLLLFGSLLLNAGWLTGDAPNQGWYSYATLTERAYSPGHNVDFWVLGLQVLGLSSLASAFNFIITIVNMRAPGMSMMRLPVFVWMTLITTILLVLAFPPLTVGMILLMFDRFYDTNFFVPAAGGAPLLWQHLFWTFGHPEVYILILPAFGIISEILPTFSRKPLFGYSAVVFAGAGIAVLGFSVWAHHMFTVGMGPVPDAVFAISTMLIALPTGVKIFNWIGTMWGGHISYKTPMLMAISTVAMFIIGGLSGVMHASVPVDLQQNDSYFVVAHFHYVLFGGAIFGLFGGIYYWFPKFTGKMLNDTLGKVHWLLMFIGFNLTFFPMHWVGIIGMPRRTATYNEGLGWTIWNQLETIGTFVLVLAFLTFVVNVWLSLTIGEAAPADPWDGATLEWTIPSPPPVYNFARVPVVTNRIPFWTEKYPEVYGHDEHERGVVAAPVEADDVTQPTTIHGQEHSHSGGHGHEDEIHLPNPSYWPLVAALGITFGFAGFIYGYWLTGIGVFLTVLGVYAWAFEPAVTHHPRHDTADYLTHQPSHVGD
jgi:cytochrome c oxidase subunit 1